MALPIPEDAPVTTTLAFLILAIPLTSFDEKIALLQPKVVIEMLKVC
jgi:hypothetical protein